MPIRILAVGKKHEPWVKEGIERYEKRLQKPYDAEWVLLPHSAREGLMAIQDESERLLNRTDAKDYVIMLDERGRLISSEQLARTLAVPLERSQRCTFIIGGAYGGDERLRERANLVWSLSPLVFPHQLVRLLLMEQLYRSQEITAGRPYHHD